MKTHKIDDQFGKWYGFAVLTVLGTVLYFVYRIKKAFNSIDIGQG